MRARALLAVAMCAVWAVAPAAARAATTTTLDCEVAHFIDPEASSAQASTRFVSMRQLIVQSWVEATVRAQSTTASPKLEDRDVRSALDRLVIEAMLGERPLPTALESSLSVEAGDARAVLEASLGGAASVAALELRLSGAVDGAEREIDTILRRRAHAQLYLEGVFSDVAAVSDADVRAFDARAPAALKVGTPEGVNAALRVYLRAMRLREAAERYYQAVRGRIRLEVVASCGTQQ